MNDTRLQKHRLWPLFITPTISSIFAVILTINFFGNHSNIEVNAENLLFLFGSGPVFF